MWERQTSQERAYAINSRLVAFAKESHLIGAWEEEPQVITAVEPLTADTGVALLVSEVIVGWARDPIPTSLDEQVFHSLVKQWREETGALSSTTEIVMSPAYQSVMAMGDKAVPFILRQLEREGDQPHNWFWALRHITRQNPVPPEHRGNRRAMARDWLDWAQFRYAW